MTYCTDTVKFTTIDKGDQTQYREGGVREITRIEEWRHLWQALKASEDVPYVDFGQYQVVAVFAGSQSSGGYSLEITGIEMDREAGLSINLEYSTPGKWIVIQSDINPYHIIQIPRMT